MEDKKRIILFLCCCLVVRSLFVVLAKSGKPTVLKIMAIVALLISAGFVRQFFVNPTKPGAFGGQPWWNNLRPVHGLLYALFAILALSKYHDKAWLVLLIDVILGLVAFTIHYGKL